MLLAFLLGVLANLSAIGQSASSLDRLPFNLIIDLSWHGQELEIRKTLSCDLHRRMHPGNAMSPDRGLKMREVWELTTSRVAHVLPSQEVLIFTVPGDVCSTFTKSLKAMPVDFLPITYWLDKAGDPKQAERIISYRYFKENPNRRFAIRRVRFVEAESLRSDIQAEQPIAYLIESPKKATAYFIGVNAVGITSDIWSRYPDLANELGRRTESGPVDRNIVARTAPDLLRFCQSAYQGIGPVAKCLTGPFDDRPLTIGSTIEGDAWRLRNDDFGVRRFVKYLDANELDSKGCGASFRTCNLWKGTFKVLLGEASYEFPRRGGGLIYDHKRRLLIHTGFQVSWSTSGGGK